MTSNKFIEQIILLYHDAREAKYPHHKISRGRSHSISSSVEDLFAKYLIELNSEIDSILVDQPVSVKGHTFYPDLSIVRANKLVAFFDIKMDLGWKRSELTNIFRNYLSKLDDIGGKFAAIKDGKSKEKLQYKISDNAIYDIVIITDQNINPTILNKHLAEIGNNESVQVHVLSKLKHPNTYGVSVKELMEEIIINNTAFDNIDKRLK